MKLSAPRQVARALNVLIVTDDPGIASFVREALTTSSGRPTLTTAATLEQALRALAENEYDCVLADLGLPDSDGLEVILRLGEHKAGSAVVVLTGRSDPELGHEAIRAGADDYLVKGEHSEQQLMHTVLDAVERTCVDQLVSRLAAGSAVVMNALGDALLVLDAAGRVESANAVARTMLGVDDPVGESLDSGLWSLSLPATPEAGEGLRLLSQSQRSRSCACCTMPGGACAASSSAATRSSTTGSSSTASCCSCATSRSGWRPRRGSGSSRGY